MPQRQKPLGNENRAVFCLTKFLHHQDMEYLVPDARFILKAPTNKGTKGNITLTLSSMAFENLLTTKTREPPHLPPSPQNANR